MSLAITHFINNDGIYAKLTNVGASHVYLDLTCTDTATSGDSYSPSTNKTTADSGMLAKTHITNGSSTQIVLLGKGNTGDSDGTFKLVDADTYKLKVTALDESRVIQATASTNFTYTAPPVASDYTLTLGTTSNAIQFAAAGADGLATNKIQKYAVFVSGPFIEGTANTQVADSSQKHWGAYIDATNDGSDNGDVANGTLDTTYVGSAGDQSQVDMKNDSGYTVVIPTATYDNGTHDITASVNAGNGAGAKVRFVVAGNAITNMFPMSGGSDYEEGNTLTFAVPKDGDGTSTEAVTYEIPAGVITGSNTKFLAVGGGLTSGDKYDVSVVAIGAGGSQTTSVSYKLIPNANANGVTLGTTQVGSNLANAPFSLAANADWDRTIGVKFTRGTQMAGDFLDKWYIVVLSKTEGGSTVSRYRRFQNPAWTGAQPGGTNYDDNTSYALAATDSGELYVKIDENAKFTTDSSGTTGQGTVAALGDFLTDGTTYTVQVNAGNVNNENSSTSSSQTNAAGSVVPQSVPDDVILSTATEPGMSVTVGSALGTSYTLTSANWTKRIRIGIKLVNPNDSNATLANGSPITAVKFNIKNGGTTDARTVNVDVGNTNSNDVANYFVGTGNDFRYHDITTFDGSDLVNGTTYEIADMQLVNANGNGDDTDSTMSAIPQTVPDAPGINTTDASLMSRPVQNQQAVSDSSSSNYTTNEQILFRWTAPNSQGNDITKFTIQHSDADDFNSDVSTVNNINPANTSQVISNLTTGDVRYGRIRAENDNGAGAWTVFKGAGDLDEFVPSAKPSFGISNGSTITSDKVSAGSALTQFSFIANFDNSDLTSIHNNGYAIAGVRIYFDVSGTTDYDAFVGGTSNYYLQIPQGQFHALDNTLALGDFISVAAGAATAGAPTENWIANTANYRYKAFIFPYNAVYNSPRNNVGAELPLTYPYYTAISDFTGGAFAVDQSAGTDITFSWSFTSAANIAPAKEVSYILAENAPREATAAGGEITYAADYADLGAGDVTGLGSTTTASSLTFSTTAGAPVYYGWKYKLTASVVSYLNKAMWDEGAESYQRVAGTSTAGAKNQSDVVPKNKPSITPGISGSDMTVTVLPNGTSLGDTFLLSPAGDRTSVLSYTDELKVGAAKYATEVPPFNKYVTYNNNTYNRANTTDLTLSDTQTVGDTSNYLIVTENGSGATISLAGSPLGLSN